MEKRRNLDIGTPVTLMMIAVPGQNHGSLENLQKRKWPYSERKQSKIWHALLCAVFILKNYCFHVSRTRS